jgi:chromosome segregation ATPase
MASRTSAQIVALEEENRRMGRLLVEAQTEQGRGGNPDHMMRMTGDLKDVRVELKKAEADRDRLAETYEHAERDRQKLEGKLAQIEVDLQEAQGKLAQAESARNVAQDALAKAEVARHKSAEEALRSAKAHDAASTGNADTTRELERLRKQVATLEKAGAAAAPAADPAELQREREGNERKIRELTELAAAAERSQKALQAEVDAAKTDAAKARAEAARARANADSQAESIVEAAGASTDTVELQRAAKEVYEAINDILSEMRNNMMLVQGELPNMQTQSPETLHAVTNAVDALIDNAETAKGALRNLRDIGGK